MTESRRLADELRQADRRKDEFLAMLGHELRNPLAPILTALELMKLRAPTSSRGSATSSSVRCVMSRDSWTTCSTSRA